LAFDFAVMGKYDGIQKTSIALLPGLHPGAGYPA
jgi:hypothetical protein